MSKNAKRAYAVASYIGASLKAYEVSDPELDRIALQTKRAMQVYSYKMGKEATLELADKLGDLWQELGDKYSHTIDEDNVPALIEGIAMIMPPKEFKQFFGVSPYYKEEHQNCKDYRKIMDSVNNLNHELNKLLGTKSVVMQKPKIKSTEVKKPKGKTKAQLKHEAEVQRIADEKAKKKKALQEMIAKAKEKVK